MTLEGGDHTPGIMLLYILEISNALPSIALDTVGLRVSTHTDPLLRRPTRLAAQLH